ncbi:hypothetical protein [Anaerococcus sp. AGMB09787]|uniref:hypothetical protein n=1 Tax=Anaerococcus sp. AGMB09787 TaxID=2922869 RepID=UPI001FB02C4C|nr:hypothetical protein [Anaerococcus sp. AGMB09787]
MKKAKFRILALLTSLTITTPTLLTPSFASDMVINNTKEDVVPIKNDRCKVVKDNEEVRIVTYAEKNVDFTLIYYKNAKFLIVKKISNGKISTNIYKNSDPILYTYFSPWDYSKDGKSYTLTAVIDTKTVTKTASYTGENVGNIDRFIDAVEDVKGDELALIGTIGFGALSAIYTGGLSLPAAISAVFGLTKEGSTMLEHYDRAREAFLKVK